MLVTVDEAKLYLRLDGTEEDALIQTLLEKADFDELTRMLKFLLYSVRKEEF